jgi:hypothetical protein
MDINLSSDDEIVHPSDPDASANQKVLAGDDTGDAGASLAEPTAHSPFGSDMPKKSKPSTTDRVLIVLPSGKRG